MIHQEEKVNLTLRNALFLILIITGVSSFTHLASAETTGKNQAASSVETTRNAAVSVDARDPWIRPTAPGQGVTGAFMTLINHSSMDYSLTGVGFDGASSVEIHETSMSDGRMRMRMVDRVDIPANGSAELKPGGYHIMLIGLEKNLEPGSEQALVLSFSDGSKKTIKAKVRSMGDSH